MIYFSDSKHYIMKPYPCRIFPPFFFVFQNLKEAFDSFNKNPQRSPLAVTILFSLLEWDESLPFLTFSIAVRLKMKQHIRCENICKI